MKLASERATKGPFKQKGHSAHLLPEELIRGDLFQEQVPPLSAVFFPPLLFFISNDLQVGGEGGQQQHTGEERAFGSRLLRLQLGKRFAEALRGKIKVKMSAQGTAWVTEVMERVQRSCWRALSTALRSSV